MLRMDGHVALVTGGANGVGAATARQMAALGAAVAIVDTDGVAAQRTGKDIAAAGGRSIVIAADVSKAEEIDAAVERTVGEFGSLDILVPNAAIQRHDRDKPVHELTEEAWDETQDVNLKGVFLTCRAGIKQMLTQGRGGAIVIVSSVAALGGSSRNSSYSASKGGLVSLGRTIALGYAKQGIRCNIVCPGALVTMPNQELVADPQGVAARVSAKVPMGRLGKHEEIAPTIVFLASSASSYTTGSVVVVDGGLTVD